MAVTMTLACHVLCTGRETWEKLCLMPAALIGTYDPATERGHVLFSSIEAARKAHRSV